MDRSNENSISLNKYLSSTGICSRREADRWIKAGRVQLNGVVAQSGNRVFPEDKVLLDGKPISEKPAPIYIAFNKPVGIVCTTDLRERKNIISYIGHPERLFPIGRLDKDSEGLIFLTNDGDIVNKVLRAGNQHEKEYLVSVSRPITARFLRRMGAGLPILGTRTLPCTVEKISERTFKITLTQGLNRQIRRMCEFLGYEVVKLRRIRIMHMQLGKLRVGEWRDFTSVEIKELLALVADSSK